MGTHIIVEQTGRSGVAWPEGAGSSTYTTARNFRPRQIEEARLFLDDVLDSLDSFRHDAMKAGIHQPSIMIYLTPGSAQYRLRATGAPREGR